MIDTVCIIVVVVTVLTIILAWSETSQTQRRREEHEAFQAKMKQQMADLRAREYVWRREEQEERAAQQAQEFERRRNEQEELAAQRAQEFERRRKEHEELTTQVERELEQWTKEQEERAAQQAQEFERRRKEQEELAAQRAQEFERRRKEQEELDAQRAQAIEETIQRAKLDSWEREVEVQQQSFTVEDNTHSTPNNRDLQKTLTALENLLGAALAASDDLKWGHLENDADYPVPRPTRSSIPPADFADRLGATLRSEYENKIKEYEARYQMALTTWEAQRDAYLKARDACNAIIGEIKSRYLSGDREAIVAYCEAVIARSQYPICFPRSYELDYSPDNELLVVDYQLPPIKSLPTLREVRHLQSRGEFVEKHLTQRELNQLYDSVLYQIALRTLHELYTADEMNALASIVFNGYVRSIDPATGHEVNPCVLSIQAGKEEFQIINLANIEPRACFRNLKGVGSSKLHSLTPIAPVVKIEREDKRFVSPRAIADGIQEGDNLAAMDWEDFEHLVRELFEKEFARPGGEVKVTRASRDGGIDAVAFDPDPLHGGKTVIQAKRYTNTVGVSAVRDLYGTVMNEGANRGILVTTSNYGPDAYEFAKGKPLVLLNGSNLLHLLQRHGYRAKIDLQEARKMLAER